MVVRKDSLRLEGSCLALSQKAEKLKWCEQAIHRVADCIAEDTKLDAILQPPIPENEILMGIFRSAMFQRLADLPSVSKACLLTFVSSVAFLIVLSSVKYFPAQFEIGFLVGRESYFYSWYAVAFYAHVISSPIALAICVVQSIRWLRRTRLRLHQRLGKAYVWIVLAVVSPSGLMMATKAGSAFAIAGFATLAVLLWATTWIAFRHALLGRISQHGQWMMRSFVLMSSAVVLRLLAAIVNTFEIEWIPYGAMAWLSWLPTLLAYEVFEWLSSRRARKPSSSASRF